MVALIQLPGASGLPGTGTPQIPVPTDVLPSGGGGGGAGAPGSGSMDPLGTVGLALLAYGLVQLLSKVVDKLPVGRHGGDPAPAGAAGTGFTPDDRKRLERILEQVAADHERIERLQEAVREIHDATRWMADPRNRADPRDGEPTWACRARTLSDPIAVNQRLSGQALDELREVNAKLDNVLRKLRALWLRVGRRRKDRG